MNPFDSPTQVEEREDAGASGPRSHGSGACACPPSRSSPIPRVRQQIDPRHARRDRSGRAARVEPLSRQLVQRHRPARRAGACRSTSSCRAALTGVPARIVVVLGALFPMIARTQGARRLCLPRAAPRVRPLRSDAPARGLALDRQLLPRRRRDLAHPGLPRRRGAAGRHERGAVRVAASAGSRARRTSCARRARSRNVKEIYDKLRRARARSGERDRQPVQRVRQLPRSLALHRAGARERVRSARTGAPRPLRLAGFVAASGSSGTLGAGDYLKDEVRDADRRGRGGRMPDAAQQRLRRAQHPGHRRQARAADPQRHEHRSGDRRQRPGDRRLERGLQHRRRARGICSGAPGVAPELRRHAALVRAVQHCEPARRDQAREARATSAPTTWWSRSRPTAPRSTRASLRRYLRAARRRGGKLDRRDGGRALRPPSRRRRHRARARGDHARARAHLQPLVLHLGRAAGR